MKLYSFIIIAFILTLSSKSQAQLYFNRTDTIKVQLANGTIMKNPWAGGLNFLQVSDIDLNYDGIMDLFVFDRTGDKVSTFINGGTANTVDYTYDHQYVSKFPKLDSWALLRDYNCDGKMDIFTHTNLGIQVYKNDGDAVNGLHFTLAKHTLYSYYIDGTPPSNYLNLYVTSTDIPAIYDVDNDGDIDVLTFDFAGSKMQWNKNFSLENYGTCDSLNYFMLVDECFGDFEENFSNNSVTLDVCSASQHIPDTLQTNDFRSSRHSGSCTLCADLNGDTLRDLILGDISFGNITFLENGGTLQMADMIAQQTSFPNNTTPVSAPIFPCSFYVDVNNDSVRDLLVSPNANTCSISDKSLWWYKNTNTDDSAHFEFQQMNFLQNEMIEVSEGAYPSFVDFNSDGLTDIIIGNYGYPDNGCVYTSKLTALKNIGTFTQPKFELFSKDYASLGALNLQNLVPAFGDLDGDNDKDMIIGASDGRIYYYQNVAAPGLTANYSLNNSLFSGMLFGQYCAPQLIDVNRDGKLDILSGRSNGKLNYYKNIGTITNPIFSADSANYFFGNVNVIPPNVTNGFSFPCMFENNGHYELLVGSANGKIYHYSNIDNNLNGSFALLDSTFQDMYEGLRCALAVSDINNDTQLDLIVGNYSGGVSFFIGDSLAGTQKLVSLALNNEIKLYPNPAKEQLFFMMNDLLKLQFINLEVYSIQGQRMYSENFIPGSLDVISTQNLPSGIYFCKLSNSNFVFTSKFVIQH
ncbi:MAG TPA: T9SS type A sorting domain-containing protein [Bacteroidia bacterium]|nr:T9SS type A sorting domain-containing protein [Bacteroidia bacterium]